MKVSKIEIRVMPADTDLTGYAYNGRYFDWFSTGRIEYYRMCGIFTVQDGKPVILGDPNRSFVTAELSCRFLGVCRFDDLLALETSVQHISDKAITFSHKLCNDHELVATGRSVHVFVDTTTGKPTPIPEGLREKLMG